MKSKSCTVKAGIIEPHSRALELPLLVRLAVSFFSPAPAEGGNPVSGAPPSYPKGNFERLSTRFNYSGYGTSMLPGYVPPPSGFLLYRFCRIH